MAYPNPENVSTITALASHTSTLTGGHFGWILLGVWGIISMVALSQKYDEKSAFAITMFQLSVFGVLMRGMGLVNDYVMFFIFFLTIIGVGLAIKQ